MKTDFLLVSYNGKEDANVYLSYSYEGRTCGLCGSFDGDESNDFELPSGEMVSIINICSFIISLAFI